MFMDHYKVNKVIKDLINLKHDKLIYVISQPTLVQGLRDMFPHYGIEYTREVHEMLVEAVQTKLVGPDIEYEWTQTQYDNFVVF
jgi:hypothetical protein